MPEDWKRRDLSVGRGKDGRIYSPSPLLGGYKEENLISDSATVIPLEKDQPNLVDVGIAAPEEELRGKALKMCPMYYRLDECEKVEELPEVRKGMEVVKIGSRTGITYGEVIDSAFTCKVGRYKFVDQILSSNKIKSGDSGSAFLLKDSHLPIGLVFAENRTCSEKNWTIANKMSNVKKELRRVYDIELEIYVPEKEAVDIDKLKFKSS